MTSAPTAACAGTSTRRRGRSSPRRAGCRTPASRARRSSGRAAWRAPPTIPRTTAPPPAATPTPTTRLNYNDHPITVPATGDNASMNVRVSWQAQASDWDIKLYEDSNGDGKSEDETTVVGTSQTGPSNVEEVSAQGTPRLTPGKKYVLRVNNFAAVENYTVDITFAAPPPFKPAQVESYTLTCEQGGRVFDTQQVQIDRGQVKQLDLSACTRAIAAAGGAQPISRPAKATPACASAAILRSVKATAAGQRRAVRVLEEGRAEGQRRRLPGRRAPQGDRRAARRALPRQGEVVHLERDVEAQASAARRLLRPLLDPPAQRPARHPPQGAAAQGRALHGPARLLPPRHLRAAALLQARARPRSAARRSARCASRSASPARRTCGSRCCAATRSRRS